MKYIIVDLDNCISDDEWRIPHINHMDNIDVFETYRVYHLLAGFDAFCPGKVFQHNEEFQNIIFTGRPIFYAPIALKWLQDYKIDYKFTFFRPMELSTMNSAQLKLSFLDALINHNGVNKKDIIAAYDDRPDVLQAYREQGIKAEMRAIHGGSYG